MKVFEVLSRVAEKENTDCYVVGGYVRDDLLGLPNDDIDIVVIGSGPKFAKAFAKEIGATVQIY